MGILFRLQFRNKRKSGVSSLFLKMRPSAAILVLRQLAPRFMRSEGSNRFSSGEDLPGCPHTSYADTSLCAMARDTRRRAGGSRGIARQKCFSA